MTDLERIKKDVVEMDSRANVCWYDTKVLTKAVRLILEELTADRKTEPQTYCDNCMYLHCNYECAGEIVHKMIDDAVIAEDVYPDLRQRMHDAVDEYEPQTDNGIGCSRCEGRFDCYDRDMPYAVRCNNYGKITDEPQTERSK